MKNRRSVIFEDDVLEYLQKVQAKRKKNGERYAITRIINDMVRSMMK